jgi:hypothetical protein
MLALFKDHPEPRERLRRLGIAARLTWRGDHDKNLRRLEWWLARISHRE